MSIIFYDIEDWEKEYVPQKIAGQQVLCQREHLSVKTAREAKVVSVYTWSRVSETVLDRMSSVRLIATRSTGADHLALEACRALGITVSNVPEYGVRTVAEHTFALILALSRKILYCDNRTRVCDFSRQGLRGFDLEGKTLGLIGCGKIGSAVASIARAFAMRVLAYDVQRDLALAQRLGFVYVDSLTELLRQSDIVSLHVPLDSRTRHLINRETIAALKRGALLINTARGDVVETQALVAALAEGRLAGAGLDVLENERLIHEEAEMLANGGATVQELSSLVHNHMLLNNPKVIVTPHNAFNSEEAVRKIIMTTVVNIESFLSGRPQNVVSLE
ncbi:MAG: hydroxyacid dehydrogenase [Candidatus Andersenbacteria bacterium]|nr:hydroxyacid dehydrogenase [Candidatus Andersenbacteria bacterium]